MITTISSRLLIQQIRWILIEFVNYQDAPKNWNPKIKVLDFDASPILYEYVSNKGKIKMGIKVGRPWILSEINNRISIITSNGELL